MTNVSSDEHDSACDYPGIPNYSVNRRLVFRHAAQRTI